MKKVNVIILGSVLAASFATSGCIQSMGSCVDCIKEIASEQKVQTEQKAFEKMMRDAGIEIKKE